MNIENSNALVAVETLTALDVFGPEGAEKIVARLEEYVRSLPARDMAVKDDREEIRSLAAKIARSKTGLDEMGKDHVADLKKQTGAVDAQRKLIRDRLDALKDEVRAPLTAYETAEANRVAEHERALVWVVQAHQFDAGHGAIPSLSSIDGRIKELKAAIARDWQEFGDRAGEAYDASLGKLQALRESVVQREAEQAELVELRRLKSERDATDLAAKRAAEAAETERRRAEAKAERERERAAEAEKAAEAAAAKAVEDERRRVAAAEAKAEVDRVRLENNKRHRAKVRRDIVEDLRSVAIDSELADRLIEAIAASSIRHVSITY